MKSCPNCRTKFDPTFTMFCPECGTSVDPSVGSMNVPTPEPYTENAAPEKAAFDSFPGSAGGELPAGASGPSSGGRFLRSMGIRIVAALLFLGIGGMISLFDDTGSSSSSDITFADVEVGDSSLGEDVNAAVLVAGDCVNWPIDDGDVFESLERLDCTYPHDAEVFALVDYPAEPAAEYPGNDAVADWGVQACYEAFEPYLGRSYEDAQELDYTFFTPTELGWRKYDDRTVQCLVYNIDESTLLTSVRTGA